MLSPEEYILDFKAEERKPQATVFDIEDIESDGTLSASEVDSNEGNTPTPPLLCKLKKVRVMMKKLPSHVLETYKLDNNSSSKAKTSSSSTVKPSRISKRKGAKNVPGLYLSLHVNKPLNKVLNVKKRRKSTFLNSSGRPLKKVKKKVLTNDKKSPGLLQNTKTTTKRSLRNNNLKNDKSNIIEKSASQKNCSTISSSSARTSGLRKTNKDCQFIKPKAPLMPNVSANRPISNLHAKIAATRPINKEEKIKRFVATLPNCPDVVITKYDLPTNMSTRSSRFTAGAPLTHPPNSLIYNPAVVPSLQTLYQAYPNSRLLTTPQHNISNQDRVSYAPSILPNLSQIQNTPTNNAFPTLIMSAPRRLPMIEPNQPPIIPTSTLTQTSFITPKANDSIAVNSPKVLVINQPALENDPLDHQNKTKTLRKRQRKDKGNYYENDREACLQSESENLKMYDTEQCSSNVPKVIKRIIYHTKSVQTKFTCNGTICGLVDSDEFNLNCFYCYEIFPLHKWKEFKEHIKIVHHVEEQANANETDEDEEETENASLTTKADTQTIVNLKARTLSNRKMLITKPVESLPKECVYKKLPLEPRLVAQRERELNRTTSTEPAKHSIAHVNKSPAKTSSQQLNQSQQSNCSFRAHTSRDLCDDIISLDSDNGEDDLQMVDEDIREHVVKNKHKVEKSLSNNLNNDMSLIDKVAKLIPPHITIKKVQKPCTSETSNINKSNIPEKSISLIKPSVNKSTTKLTKTTDTSLDEPFIKVPSNFNIQRVIKYIPKPTIEKSTGVESSKPRYFVVKKIVKPANKIPNLNVSKGMILNKRLKTDDNNLPSNDENEDAMPKPTNGSGIIFGLTNPMVVIEFLLKLKSFPELWRPQIKTNSANYDESIKKLCLHLNNRFELNIKDTEMRLSIQRVKDWYCRMLNKIYEHNKNCNNTEPFKHKFPLYFKILNQFLISDAGYASNRMLSSHKSDTNINKWMVNKAAVEAPKTSAFHLDKDNSLSLLKPTNNTTAVNKDPTEATATTTADTSTTLTNNDPPPPVTETTANSENNTDSLIEFDADILYEDESSDEEVLEPFDETKPINKKINQKLKEPGKRRTKTYLGRYECDVCKKVYKRKCDLRRHRIHHYPPQFECSVCLQKFFFKHWAEKCNHLKKRKYNTTNKSDKTEGGVETVIPKKWPKKIFRFKLICEICGASYRQIGSLNCHKRDKHLNQRLKCVVCSFTALTNYRIVQHQKKRHIVEPGTVEEVAKKSRARTETKTPFSVEARQEFDWRREMRKKLQPGEKFFACCKCRIIFNSRKEKVLHNKLEHPIKETSVVCLLCLPNKFVLSNSNSARRHYTDIHKVPWDEIDDLVKRTKPVFNILSKDEIELLNASRNWKELLEELIKDRELEPVEKIKTQIDEEAIQAVQNLPIINSEPEIDVNKIDEECETKEEENVYVAGLEENTKNENICVDNMEAAKEENVYVDNIEAAKEENIEGAKEENVYVDGIIDHDYNNEEMVYTEQYTTHNNNEHDYSEEQGEAIENYNNYEEELNERNNDQLYEHSPNVTVEGISEPIAYNIECTEDVIDDHQNTEHNDQEYLQTIVDDLVEGELVDGQLVEECIVVEECIDDVIDNEMEYF